MALGVPGTGPYGQIRMLQEEINACEYELWLIAEGIRINRGSKRLKEIIRDNRIKIKKIKEAEKMKTLKV